MKEPPFFLYDEFVNKLIIFLLSVFLFGCSSTDDYIRFHDENGKLVILTGDEYPEYMANKLCKRDYPNRIDECLEQAIPLYIADLEKMREEERDRKLAEENKNEDSDDGVTNNDKWSCTWAKTRYRGYKDEQKKYERQAKSYYKDAQSLARADRRNEANYATRNGNKARSRASKAENQAKYWKREHNKKCSPKIW